jgi:putative ABC transport system permease protein
MDSFRSAAERLYRRLLSLYPGEFRAEFGDEMRLLFEDRSRDERLDRLMFEVLVDTARTAPREHLSMLFQDLRYALRSLRHNPGFTLVAAGSLALGIGASAAIFAMADALLLRPLPVASPGEIVGFRNTATSAGWGGQFNSVSYLDYRDLREQSRTLSGLAASSTFDAALSRGQDETLLTWGVLVSGNFFTVLGVEPALGRGFRPDEETLTGEAPVVVLTHATWNGLFEADPEVLGRTVKINGTAFTVVGVAPERFTGLHPMLRPAFYVPLSMAPALLGKDGEGMLQKRDWRGLRVDGRLRPGTSVTEASAEIALLTRNLAATHPDTNRNQALDLRTPFQARIESSPPDAAIVTMLMTLVALVLLIACANVAGLLVSRSAARGREIAVRLAVGASRSRLVRQLLTESLLLALLGGSLGIAIAVLGVRFFRSMPMPTDIPIVLDVRLDLRVLLFSLAASLVCACLFGLMPALGSSRSDVVTVLKAGDAPSGLARLLGRKALVVGQLAFALVLLAASMSLFRGIEKNLRDDPGFRTTNLLTASFDPGVRHYTAEWNRAFYRELLDRSATLPGVLAASLTRAIPMSNGQMMVSFAPEGYTLPEGRTSLTSFGNVVDSTYFATAGVPIVAGRAFAKTDDADAPRVAIVNEETARRYWPGQDPVGKRVRLEGPEGPFAEIVGVARTHRYLWLGESPQDFLYLPYLQAPEARMTLLLLTEGDPRELASALRALAASVGPEVPVHNVVAMEDLYLARGVRMPRMIVTTVASMGLTGLLLALVGLYGLMAYSVSRRTREIGIRMAIGADRGSILALVIRQGLSLALPGVAIGLIASVATSRLLAATVAGVSANDPASLVAIPAVLVMVTMLAALVPALRAARLDPRDALRQE